MPGLAQLEVAGERVGGQTRLDERLIEAPRGTGGQDVCHHVDGGEVLVRAGRHVIGRHRELDIADAPQGDGPLAVLGGLGGVRPEKLVRARAVRPREDTELLGDEFERPIRIEAAGDDEDRIVRLVVLPVEGLQPVDGHILDVRARADGGIPVVVPVVGGGQDPLLEYALRAVLPPPPIRSGRPSSRNRGPPGR